MRPTYSLATIFENLSNIIEDYHHMLSDLVDIYATNIVLFKTPRTCFKNRIPSH